MNIDIDQLIKLGLITANNEVVISNGDLYNSLKNKAEYRITIGWDIIAAHQCDTEWKKYNFDLADYINANYTADKIPEVLENIQVEDHHWEWVAKSLMLKGSEYEWFYLKTNNRIEAACLMYHPKASAVDNANIFYIDFIAVAPWNRKDPMRGKELYNVGSTLLKEVIRYSVNTLGLTYRFSLHSLPQAKKYYNKIGMQHFPCGDKDALEYFEMNENDSISFISRA